MRRNVVAPHPELVESFQDLNFSFGFHTKTQLFIIDEKWISIYYYQISLSLNLFFATFKNPDKDLFVMENLKYKLRILGLKNGLREFA